ncbi:TetR/AcrR family transcriptional regulator [Inquilinus sp. OTU3971]|uniref:TetR/AcrR family transcriptional regulator n=1 Tax=Inquilinus sp. OTU3971 TaxID=3043855 RepID=UPI00313D6180
MKTDPPRSRGRPRGFDRDAALDRALPVFWRQGYEGASVADLTAAMGITTPSLYGAFGSKERLYREALDRYRADPQRAAPWAMAAPTAREAVRLILEGSARDFSDPAHPPGCMISTAVLTCAPENRPAAAMVTSMRGNTVARLRTRFARALEEGELPPGTDPDELARFYGAIIQGLSVQALDGAGRDDLMKIVRRAMAAWPED